MIHFDQELQTRIQAVDASIQRYFAAMDLPAGAALTHLKEAMLYSAGSGGKRFRPVLSLLVGELFSCPAARILPFAMAIEFVHTYSLIHDDLPCMDNDDLRRGKPTNHKVYGEAKALLAGDALLTEAFFLLAREYKDASFLSVQLTELLGRSAGLRGMVGGQALDIEAENGNLKSSQEELVLMHTLKTGRLIQAAAEGAALIAGASPSEVESMSRFGEALGLAFQITDDILDASEKGQEDRSFVTLLGLEGTHGYLQKVSERAWQELRQQSRRSPVLEHMIEFNRTRHL